MDDRSPVKILLVDDRPANLLALHSALASPEYELVKARSGPEALGFLLRNECALILMDVNMPEMDGYETARLIRKNERTRNIPIVFITAYGADERQVLTGYESGAIDYLFKPVVPEVLRSKVAAFAALYRAQRQLLQQAELLREHERREHAHELAQLELKSLRRQEAVQRRYRTLIDGISHVVVWVVDPVTLVCRFVSPSAELILGYPLERWLSQPDFWRERLHRDDRGQFLTAIQGMAPGAAAVKLQHRLVRADGRAAWFETTVRLLPADDADRMELRGFSVDITEEVHGREALEFLASVSAGLTESLDCRDTAARAARASVPMLCDFCIVEVTPPSGASPVVAVAHQAADMEEAVRRLASHPALARLGSGQSVEVVNNPAERLRQASDPDLDRQVEILQPGSAVVMPLAARGAALGRIWLFTGGRRRHGARERTLAEELGRRLSQGVDNALLYQQARDTVQLREEFLSVASHELRTPLSALTLQGRLLDQLVTSGKVPAPLQGDLQRRIRSANRQVDRLVTLVNSLLDLARIRSGRMTLDVAGCDLRELVREIRARFEEIPAVQGRVHLSLSEEPIVGLWDRSRLDQLLTNLVANAVKYGGTGPISLSVDRGAGLATVSVSDTGPGIPQSEQGRIFDRFEQGIRDASSGSGLGLGLYIARKIAEAHGGRISVESAPGKGATFRVDLPIGVADAPNAHGAEYAPGALGT